MRSRPSEPALRPLFATVATGAASVPRPSRTFLKLASDLHRHSNLGGPGYPVLRVCQRTPRRNLAGPSGMVRVASCVHVGEPVHQAYVITSEGARNGRPGRASSGQSRAQSGAGMISLARRLWPDSYTAAVLRKYSPGFLADLAAWLLSVAGRLAATLTPFAAVPIARTAVAVPVPDGPDSMTTGPPRADRETPSYGAGLTQAS